MIKSAALTVSSATLPVFFAQLAPPTPDGLHAWLTAAVCVAGVYYLVLRIIKEHRKPERSPSVDVEMNGLATKDSVARLEIQVPNLATRKELSDTERRLSEQMTAVSEEQETRRRISIGNLHEKMEQRERAHSEEMKLVDRELATVSANQETTTAAVSELSRKIDVLLQRQN